MSISNELVSKIPNRWKATKCRDGRRSVVFENFRESILIDMDKVGPLKQRSRCDFVYLARSAKCDKLRVVVVEFKGKAEASKTIQQLNAGAGFATAQVKEGRTCKFYPVVMYSGDIHPADIHELREKRPIRFGGETFSVELKTEKQLRLNDDRIPTCRFSCKICSGKAGGG